MVSQKKVEPNKDDLKRIIKDREKIKLSKKIRREKSYLEVNLFFRLMADSQGFLEVREY